MSLSRRTLLRASATASAGLIGGPAILSWMSSPAVAAAVKAFADDYKTNVPGNITVETNGAVRILSGFQELWQTGTAWNTGTPLATEVLRANMRFCEARSATRTPAEEARAFIVLMELSNFRRAADVLNMSQPALSRRIQKLEQAVQSTTARGGTSINPGSGGSTPSASAGAPSVTRLIHRSCVAISGRTTASPFRGRSRTRPSSTPKNIVITSPIFDESR